MKGFNLSEWALRHRNFVLYLMILTLALGVFVVSPSFDELPIVEQ